MSVELSQAIWFLGLIGWIAIRWPNRRRAKKLAVKDDRKSFEERTLLSLCIVGLVVLPFVHILTDWLETYDQSFGIWRIFLGLPVMVGFLVLFRLSHKHLKSNWSVSLEVRKGHTLVQNGVYSHVRHPMYASFFLWGLAQLILLPNWIAGPSGLIAVALLYFMRIGKEEKMMRDQFGTEYDDYCKNTTRLIPKLI